MLKRFLGLMLALATSLCAQSKYVKYYNSIADLVAVNPNDVSLMAQVKYASSSGSADTGGSFYYDANSVAATNTTTVFKPTNYGGRWIRSANPTGSSAAVTVPTGTGFRHVTVGIEDAATKLVDTTDINPNQVTYDKIQDVSATQRILGRNSPGVGDVEEVPLSTILDWLGSNQGSIIYRGAAGWSVLTPGTSGFFLKTQGGGADPVWANPATSASISYVNGVSVTLANFNNSTPSPSGPGVNVIWQVGSLTNVSAYIQAASSSLGGVVTANTQTIHGTKTFEGDIIVTNQVTSPIASHQTNYAGALNVTNNAAVGGTLGANNLVISNWSTPGLVYNPGSGSVVSPVTMGNGLQLSSGVQSVQWSSVSAQTNSNAGMGIGGLVLTKPEKRALVTLTTNNYAIDMTSDGPGYYMIGTNGTINLSFANVPTDTNSIAGPWTMILTNSTTSDETLIMNWGGVGDFIGKTDPVLKATNETILYFWYSKGYIRGDFNGPSLRDDQHTLTTITATSAVTNYVADFGRPRFLIVAANDVFFLNSTNRSVDTTVWQDMTATIRASGANRRLDLNSNWHLAPGTTTPLTITNGSEATLRFWDNGPSETNVTVAVTYLPSVQAPYTDSISGTLLRDSGGTSVWNDGSQGFLWVDSLSLNEPNGSGFSFGSYVAGTGTFTDPTYTTNTFFGIKLSAPAANDPAARRTSAGIQLGDGVWEWEGRVQLGRVPTGAQDTTMRLGFATFRAGNWITITNGAYWQASSTNANWVMVCVTNAVFTITATTTNLNTTDVVWLSVTTSNLNNTAYFRMGPTKQIMKTNLVGTVTGVGMGNLAQGHVAGCQILKVNGSGTDNPLSIYYQSVEHTPSNPL